MAGIRVRGGRPDKVTEETVLVLMAAVAMEERALHLQQVTNIIIDHTGGAVLCALGLPDCDHADYREPNFR